MSNLINKIKTNKYLYSVVIPIVLFLIAFLWKFAYISSRDICLDEPFTIFNAQKSISNILSIPKQGPNVPLFMFILHFWIKVFGIGPTAIRILPLLFNSLTSVFLYKTGRKFFNVPAGIIASGLFILSTYHFYFGLEARSYALMSLLTASALYYFLSIIKEPSNSKHLIGLIISNSLLVYSHYFGWFILFVQFGTSFMYIRNRQFLKRIILAFVLTGIFFSPYAIILIKQFFVSSQGTWVSPPAKSEYLNQIKYFLNAPIVLKICFWSAVAGVLYSLYLRKWNRNIKELIIVGLWWFVPFTIMFLVSNKVPMFLNRYILFTSIGLYMAIGGMIWYLFQENKFFTALVVILVLAFAAPKLEINSKDFYYREVRNAVKRVKHNETDRSIVLIHPHWAHLGFTYYYAPEIFKDVENYEERLEEASIFPVWNQKFAKEIIERNSDKKVVYYQDGSLFADNKNSIYNYLDSTFVKTDTVFYPQCFYVSSFITEE